MPDQTYTALAAHADSILAMVPAYGRLRAIRIAFSCARRTSTAREHLIVARLMA